MTKIRRFDSGTGSPCGLAHPTGQAPALSGGEERTATPRMRVELIVTAAL